MELPWPTDGPPCDLNGVQLAEAIVKYGPRQQHILFESYSNGSETEKSFKELFDEEMDKLNTDTTDSCSNVFYAKNGAKGVLCGSAKSGYYYNDRCKQAVSNWRRTETECEPRFSSTFKQGDIVALKHSPLDPSLDPDLVTRTRGIVLSRKYNDQFWVGLDTPYLLNMFDKKHRSNSDSSYRRGDTIVTNRRIIESLTYNSMIWTAIREEDMVRSTADPLACSPEFRALHKALIVREEYVTMPNELMYFISEAHRSTDSDIVQLENVVKQMGVSPPDSSAKNVHVDYEVVSTGSPPVVALFRYRPPIDPALLAGVSGLDAHQPADDSIVLKRPSMISETLVDIHRDDPTHASSTVSVRHPRRENDKMTTSKQPSADEGTYECALRLDGSYRCFKRMSSYASVTLSTYNWIARTLLQSIRIEKDRPCFLCRVSSLRRRAASIGSTARALLLEMVGSIHPDTLFIFFGNEFEVDEMADMQSVTKSYGIVVQSRCSGKATGLACVANDSGRLQNVSRCDTDCAHRLFAHADAAVLVALAFWTAEQRPRRIETSIEIDDELVDVTKWVMRLSSPQMTMDFQMATMAQHLVQIFIEGVELGIQRLGIDRTFSRFPLDPSTFEVPPSQVIAAPPSRGKGFVFSPPPPQTPTAVVVADATS